MSEKQKTALERLKERLAKANTPPVVPVAPAVPTKSENLLAPVPTVPYNAKATGDFVHELDAKALEKSILATDFTTGANLLDESGAIDLSSLNTLLQKVAYNAVTTANSNFNEGIGSYATASESLLDSKLSSYDKTKALEDKVYSEDKANQQLALFYREQKAQEFPDATAAELDEITRDYLKEIVPEDTKPAKVDVTEETLQETDWEKELGIEIAPTPPAEDTPPAEGTLTN